MEMSCERAFRVPHVSPYLGGTLASYLATFLSFCGRRVHSVPACLPFRVPVARAPAAPQPPRVHAAHAPPFSSVSLFLCVFCLMCPLVL